MKNSISTEELLKQLEAKEDDSSISLPDALKFLEVFDIKSGTIRVKTSDLYELYHKWSKDPIAKNRFYLEMNNFFGCPQNGYIAINKKVEAKKKRSALTIPTFKRHFETFLAKFNLTKGTFQLNTVIAYDLYDKWRYEVNRKAPLSKFQFNQFAELYFDMKKDDSNKYIGVDKSILNHLTDEQKLKCLSPKGQKHANKKEENKKV